MSVYREIFMNGSRTASSGADKECLKSAGGKGQIVTFADARNLAKSFSENFDPMGQATPSTVEARVWDAAESNDQKRQRTMAVV